MGNGRHSVPGERGISSIVNPTAVHNRTIRAQITSVDADNGFVLLTYESLPAGGKYATVPPLWMSFPSGDIGGPAWGRYMPQISDMVKVSFDYNDEPRLVGYDVIAAKKNVADGYTGWPQLKEQNANAQSSDDNSRAKFGQFNPLAPGEYDFMSSGGAYIYGNTYGRLYMAGGAVSISLIKNDLRLQSRAQLWSHIADDSEFKFGQVRRRKSDGTEAIVSGDQDGQLKEMSAKIYKSTDSGKQDVAHMVMGNVLDDSGTQISTPNAQSAVRHMLQIFNANAELRLRHFFDQDGNWEIHAPNAGAGVYIDFTNADWKSRFKSVEWTVSDKTTWNSPTVEFNSTTKWSANSPSVNLAAVTATNPLFLTNIYGPAERTVITALAASINTLSIAVSNGMGALASLATSMSALVPAVLPQATIAAAAATASATTGPAATSAASVFTNAYDTYLSTKARTE